MKKQLLFIATLIVSLFISQNVYSTHHVVNTLGNTFDQDTLSINIGDTVTWNNTGGFHNVNGSILTFPLNPQGFENPGGVSSGWTYTHIFTLAGQYNYQCDPHVMMGMIGVIQVGEAVNLDQIKGSIADTKSKFILNAERLENYLSRL